MKKYQLLLTFSLMFVFSFKVYGEYSFYHFKDELVQVAPEMFHRYIRPQLKAIQQEYFHLLRKMNPLSNEVIELRNSIVNLTLESEKFKEVCETSDKECVDYLKMQHNNALKLEKDIHNLRLTKIKLDKPESIDEVLNLHLRLDEISLLNYRLIHLCEQMEMNTLAGYPVQKNFRLDALQIISTMGTLSDLILTVFLDSQFANEFDFLWVNFISPIENKVINQKDFKFLISKLDNFNTAINSFHMKLSKSEMPTPQPVVQLIAIIHNRWNSILKIILNNYQD